MSHTFTSFIMLALLVFGLHPSSAFAHKMEVQAVFQPAADGQPARIDVEAWYEFGETASGKAILSGGEGQELATAELDAEKGTCTFPLAQPAPGAYKITVDDGAGHRSWVILTIAADDPSVVAVQTEQRNRWLMGAIGLGLIAGITVLAVRRSGSSPSSPPSSPHT